MEGLKLWRELKCGDMEDTGVKIRSTDDIFHQNSICLGDFPKLLHVALDPLGSEHL